MSKIEVWPAEEVAGDELHVVGKVGVPLLDELCHGLQRRHHVMVATHHEEPVRPVIRIELAAFITKFMASSSSFTFWTKAQTGWLLPAPLAFLSAFILSLCALMRSLLRASLNQLLVSVLAGRNLKGKK
jgi:hypothetical protein